MREGIAQHAWISAALFLLTTTAAWAEKERCVAAPDGQWRCGKNITDADAAPLPAPSQRITPPMLLIDPKRFGEVDRPPTSSAQQTASVATDAANPNRASETKPAAAANSASLASSNVAESSYASTAETAARATPTSTAPATASAVPAAAEALDFSAPSTGYAVQLSVASSPRGFGALLAKLGKRTNNFQQRQLRNGNWVLLLGNFPTPDAARAAIPSAIPGAFVRNLADLSFK